MIKITIIDDDGVESDYELPSKMEVCDDCSGHGFVLTEGMRGVAYSREDFEEQFDFEEQEQYFTRGGRYDVKCPTCHGANVVSVIDEKLLTEKQKEIASIWESQENEKARMDQEDRQTMRMEMGIY